MKVEFIYHNFEELIPTGAANAISVQELSQLTGMSTRSVRATVSRLRRQGAKIICSNSDATQGRCGFFYPENDDEVRRYVRNERHKLRTYHAALRPAERYIKELDAQVTDDGA